MATDTWWHGQRHWFARMGEASWPTRFDHNDRLSQGPTLYSSHSKRRQRISSAQTRWPQSRTCASKGTPSAFNLLLQMMLATVFLVQPSTAVFINFENCLSPNTINSNPQMLQFVPLYVWATFNSTTESHGLNVTVYGNVTGFTTEPPYPPSNALSWTDPTNVTGKIPDVGVTNGKPLFTTFETSLNVLDYTPYSPNDVRFCNSSALTPCPFAPVFNTTINESVHAIPVEALRVNR